MQIYLQLSIVVVVSYNIGKNPTKGCLESRQKYTIKAKKRYYVKLFEEYGSVAKIPKKRFMARLHLAPDGLKSIKYYKYIWPFYGRCIKMPIRLWARDGLAFLFDLENIV